MATDLSGSYNPSKSTVGVPGQVYTNTVTKEKWRCLAVYNAQAKGVNATEYFWVRVGGALGQAAGPVTYVESLDSENRTPLRSLDSGTYVLHGYFTSYEGAANVYTFSAGMLVSIVKTTNTSYVQIFYAKSNTIQYLEIADDNVTRKDAKLVNMESIANKVDDIHSNSDHNHYPSAKTVYNALPKWGTTAPTNKTEGKVGMAYYVIVDSKITEMYVCVDDNYVNRTWAKVELGTFGETTTEGTT